MRPSLPAAGQLAALGTHEGRAALAQHAHVSWVAGCFHMFTFMAGASSTGARVASATVVTRSSASPCASGASVWAVAGATTKASAQSARAMWSISPSSEGSKTCVRTGAPVRLWSTSGVTKWSASGVAMQRTACPARRRARTSSGTL